MDLTNYVESVNFHEQRRNELRAEKSRAIDQLRAEGRTWEAEIAAKK